MESVSADGRRGVAVVSTPGAPGDVQLIDHFSPDSSFARKKLIGDRRRAIGIEPNAWCEELTRSDSLCR